MLLFGIYIPNVNEEDFVVTSKGLGFRGLGVYMPACECGGFFYYVIVFIRLRV